MKLAIAAVLMSAMVPCIADENTPRHGLTSAEVRRFLDSLPAKGMVVSDLRLQFDGHDVRYEVAASANADDVPWLALINLTTRRYQEAAQHYQANGYRMTVHRAISVDRRVHHSAVWVRAASDVVALKIPLGPLPETGRTRAGFQPVDHLMRSFLRQHHLPGATLAVSKDGRLVYSRGFGYANTESGEVMQPNAAMRIASVSKPITAVAVLQLIEQKRIRADDRLMDVLRRAGSLRYMHGDDQRWNEVTIQQLLHHSGGWDRDVTSDPMFQGVNIQRALGLKQPPTAEEIVQFQLTQPLDFAPGSRFVYSNLGYCLLGRVVECTTGMTYHDYVRQNILDDCGMRHTYPGRTRPHERAPGEVSYHTQRQLKQLAYWLDSRTLGTKRAPQLVPEQYGHWDLSAMDSHGGWVSTAPDLLRFLRQLDSAATPLLNDNSIDQMVAPPDNRDRDLWYADGWNVRPGPDNTFTYWHTGSLAGTSSLLVRRNDGWSWSVLFNCDRCADRQLCAVLIEPLVHQAIADVRDIPPDDLFDDTSESMESE